MNIPIGKGAADSILQSNRGICTYIARDAGHPFPHQRNQMKAAQFNSFGVAEVLGVIDLPRPQPEGEEVLIAVSAAGVSFVDIRQRQGAYNRAETRVGGVKLPNIPGLQAVGRVIELGPQADKSLLGRKVVTVVERGAYAELLIASSSLCVAAPDDADDAVLAVLPMQGLTAYFMLTASTVLRAGESVLVHAASSGVGALVPRTGLSRKIHRSSSRNCSNSWRPARPKSSWGSSSDRHARSRAGATETRPRRRRRERRQNAPRPFSRAGAPGAERYFPWALKRYGVAAGPDRPL
jgi:hypothetical protein